MAITRTQIARQLYRYGGDTMGGPNDKSKGISEGNTAREQGIMNQYQGPKGTTLGFDKGPTEIIGGKEFPVNPPTEFEQEKKNFAISLENDRRRREAKKRALKERTFLQKLGKLGYTDRTLDDNLVNIGAINRQFATIGGVPTGFVGPAIGALTVDPATNFFDIDSIREIASTKTTTGGSLSAKDADTLGDIREDIEMRDRILDPNDNVTQSEFEDYMNRNKIEDTGGDGIQDPCKGPNPPAYCFTGIRSVEPEKEEKEETVTPKYRFMNKGGMADVVGGEYDFESARQMYGLGKLVKKVTRTVKKIAKSPIGKAALLYAGTAGLGALGAKFGTGVSGTGFGIFKPGNVLANLGASKAFLADKFLGPQMIDTGGEVFRSGGLFSKFPGGGVGAGIIGLSALSGLLTKKEEDEDGEVTIDRGEKLEFPENRYRFFQEGGSTEKEPVAKKTMPLLDMGGKEKDYRETGGFVDMGRMEKADDVPARLSKNEFVFTADAVRNAGDGSVDKGAEVMYNMMKNLEAGGDVSEESQGLEGARKMFQTSQRLGEVI